jgi:hypothetical protein
MVVLMVVAAAAAFVLLGAFPQHLTRTPIEHTVQVDRLGH